VRIVPRALSWLGWGGLSNRDAKLTTHLGLVPRSRVVELYLYIRFVVLYCVSTGSTLPVPGTSAVVRLSLTQLLYNSPVGLR
jgi:hypothetical protein